MNTVQSATITPVLAAGSTTSPYLFLINISQRLCTKACVDNPPVFTPQYTLVGYTSLGGTAYAAIIQVQGLISYVPCGSNNCCAKTQPLSQKFTVPFQSPTAPTSVSVEAVGATVNTIATTACQTCSRTFVSETPISLTVA